MDDDHSSIGFDSSERGRSAGGASRASDEAEKELRNQIIEAEEKHVRKARMAVAAAIFVCTLAVSTAVYLFSAFGEHHSFETEYGLHVEEMKKLIQWEVQYNFALMQQLSASVTTAAITTGAVFPNLTQPYFEISGGYVDGLGGIISTAFAPLVQSEERDQWDAYSFQKQGWIADSEALREMHPEHIDPMRGTNQDHERSTNQDHDHGIGQNHDHGSSNEAEFEVQGYVETESESSDEAAPSSTTPDFYRSRHLESKKGRIAKTIFRWENGTRVKEESRDGRDFAPLWQTSPPVAAAVNVNLFSERLFEDLFQVMVATKQTVLSPATEIGDIFDFLFSDEEKERKRNPHTFILQPVYQTFLKDTKLAGVLVALTAFENLLDKLLPTGTEAVTCVISDSCGNKPMTYEVIGQESKFMGYGDLHDTKFDEYMQCTDMELYNTTVDGLCAHKITIYPTRQFVNSFKTSKPAIYTFVVALAFLVTSIILFIYDKSVTRRQEKTMRSALASGALVESLFPANVRERVMATAEKKSDKKQREEGTGFATRPIADFFPNTTLMFADISGFTAWSSTREPFQVFELLETLYGAFDAIAKKRRIFKVETVGDCYVAASGLPVARDDHAVAMARFARDCLFKMNDLTRQLEVALGPDTSALAFRIGLHSGPVTGGVLRGENARFQLFGDTVNTASRMESTGLPHKIQISQTTADLLIAASKSCWIVPRDEKITAKGKGSMQTFWLIANDPPDGTSSHGNNTNREEDVDNLGAMEPTTNATPAAPTVDPKIARLVDWNSELLLRLLKLIVACRDKNKGEPTLKWHTKNVAKPGSTVLDEVAEIITLPSFNGSSCRPASPDSPELGMIRIPKDVEDQLRSFVAAIASLYREDNHFHNFEHASHVTMSVSKLLGRIVVPSVGDSDNDQMAADLHDNTYGITSDPLTQFACVFSALIHDVDHPGVPNTQLVAEQSPLAATYKNKSVAEQNSVDMAWNLLLQPCYQELRRTLCATMDEMKRFRQLVVNAVMATDIMAPDLKAIRDGRWSKAFLEPQQETAVEESPADTINRKATIVIEHLLLASDVCHTMQHWHVYRKWNERLFAEMSAAYRDGRASKDPADGWYNGELWFFDNYIIPLARKLAQCGVFGVSSDEYLNYAQHNRDEWEKRGRDVVAEMVQALRVSCEAGIAGAGSSGVDRRTHQIKEGVAAAVEDVFA